MSFSANIKEELSKLNTFSNIDIVKAELYGYLLTVDNTKPEIKFLTENEYNINRLNKLLNKLDINYNIKMQGKNYLIEFKKSCLEEKRSSNKTNEEMRAEVRGAFLGSGSITDPNIRYHLEIKLKTSSRKRRNNKRHK